MVCEAGSNCAMNYFTMLRPILLNLLTGTASSTYLPYRLFKVGNEPFHLGLGGGPIIVSVLRPANLLALGDELTQRLLRRVAASHRGSYLYRRLDEPRPA